MPGKSHADSIFQSALAAYRTGNLLAAGQWCHQALAADPNHLDSLHLAGLLAIAAGDFASALPLLQKAAESSRAPASPNAAAAAIWNNLANVQAQLGRLNEAIASTQRAIEIDPDFADAHFNLANYFKHAAQREAAIKSYRRALALRPADPDYTANAAAALSENDQPDEAIALLRTSLIVHPHRPDLWNNLGNALKDIAQLDEALSAFGKALNMLAAKTGVATSVATASKPLLSQPDPLQSQAARIHSNLIYAMHFHRSSSQADIQRELKAFNQNFAQNLRPMLPLPPLPVPRERAGVRVLEFSETRPSPEPSPLRARASIRLSSSKSEPKAGVPGEGENAISPSPSPRLRIGFLGAEFRAHVVGRFLLPLLIHHDRARFEIFCYADSNANDEITALYRANADHWKPVAAQPDDELAETIAADNLDLLFDIQLHMAHNRLMVFARKPATVQATYCGYPGSTGLSTVDFRITDAVLDPPQSTAPTVETPIRLPRNYWCYDPEIFGYLAPEKAASQPPSQTPSQSPSDTPGEIAGQSPNESPAQLASQSPPKTLWTDLPVNPLPALTNGYLTFGCFNNFCKIDVPMLALWASAMQAAPNSRLKMMAPPGSARRWVTRTLANHGISENRIDFVGRQSRQDYFRGYHQIDVALDTLPANGHTTSLDSFWMGVPVITRVGDTAMGRATWSQLLHLNLSGLAADTDEQFREIAKNLAADLPALANLRAELRPRVSASPMTDARQFTKDFEAACEQMCAKSQSP